MLKTISNNPLWNNVTSHLTHICYVSAMQYVKDSIYVQKSAVDHKVSCVDNKESFTVGKVRFTIASSVKFT